MPLEHVLTHAPISTPHSRAVPLQLPDATHVSIHVPSILKRTAYTPPVCVVQHLARWLDRVRPLGFMAFLIPICVFRGRAATTPPRVARVPGSRGVRGLARAAVACRIQEQQQVAHGLARHGLARHRLVDALRAVRGHHAAD